MLIRRTFVVCSLGTSALLAIAPARAGDGGFEPGTLYLRSPAVTGSSSTDGALVAIDPTNGGASLLVDEYATPSLPGNCVYDRFRDRVLICAKLGSSVESQRLHAVDAFGNVQTLGFANESLSAMSSAHDGRIFLRRQSTPVGQIQYLDASNGLHTLLDAAGAAPFVLSGSGPISYAQTLYHEASNSLLVASGPGSGVSCAGALATGVVVRRLPLSADGTRVVGPIACGEFDVSSSGETIAGLSWMTNGNALLVVDTNSNAAEPRMLEIDPLTLAITPFATNGSYIGAAATNAGTWSSALGQAVVLDTFSDLLRAYSAGGAGLGTSISTSIPVSSPLASGEIATLIEVPSSPCLGGLHGYGSGKAGKAGFVPALGGSGCAIPGGTLTITIGSVVGGANGMLFVGTTKAAQPFVGGTLLVFPIQLALPLTMPGTVGVAGDGNVQFPATLPSDPALSGLSLFVQGVFADSAASAGASLTGGLEITIG